MTKWIVSTPLKGTDLMKNFVCFTEVELQKLLEQYPEAIVEMKDSHLEEHAPLPLTDDQQVVLEWWVKKLNEEGEDADPLGVICAMQSYGLRDETIYDAAVNLIPVQQFQVLAAFADWGLSHAEE